MAQTNCSFYYSNRKSPMRKLFEIIRNKLHFFGDNSSFDGVKHVLTASNIPIFKRIFWLVILILSSMAAGAILRGSLLLYSGGSISYSVETTYLDWNTPFPAITICEYYNDRFASQLKENNISKAMSQFYEDASFWSYKFCKSCGNCQLGVSCSDNMLHIMKSYRLQCSQLLTDCWWGDKWFSCCDRFLPSETEYGVCYTFNSRLLLNDSSLVYLSRKTGLASLVFSATTNINVLAHAQDETLSAASENIRSHKLPLVTDFEVILKVEETVSDTAVQALPADMRGCLLWWERPKFARFWSAARYSYGACALHCRASAQIETCNCTHHLMPRLDGVPPCNVEGLKCLQKNKRYLVTVSCDCPPICEEVIYEQVHVFFNRRKDISGELSARGTRGLVRLVQLSSLRVRRQAIRDTLGLVVDVGGVLGVFFGASLLSIVEVFYIFFMRRGI